MDSPSERLRQLTSSAKVVYDSFSMICMFNDLHLSSNPEWSVILNFSILQLLLNAIPMAFSLFQNMYCLLDNTCHNLDGRKSQC